jgi:hypothetical protein
MPVEPETFPEQAPGAVTDDRATDFFAGDHAEFRGFAVRKLVPIGDQAAEHQAFAFLPYARKIAVLPEPQVAAQKQALRRGVHKKSDGREAFAAGATAAGDGGCAAFGLVAGEKAVLAFAADFRRLILAFHKF